MKMKMNMRLITMILAGALFFFASCSKNDTPAPEEDNTRGESVVANLNFGSGKTIDFGASFFAGVLKPTIMHNKEDKVQMLLMDPVMTVDGISYLFNVIAVIEEEGIYTFHPDNDDNDPGVSFTLSVGRETDNAPTVYLPIRLSDETMGSCELKITSLTKTHMKATFSGVLYSENDKVIIKEGKIDTDIVWKEVE